jgi:hypothetical protein
MFADPLISKLLLFDKPVRFVASLYPILTTASTFKFFLILVKCVELPNTPPDALVKYDALIFGT